MDPVTTIYRTRGFAMTVTNNHLVLVGGIEHFKTVGVWRPDSKKWTHPYPDMPTPRSHCSAVAYKEWLVVAGGFARDDYLSSVEVLNTGTKQWSAGLPTPKPWAHMQLAIVGDVCYFMGGFTKGSLRTTTKVYSVSLPALTSQLNSGARHRDSQIWKVIFGLQVARSSPLSISGSLLAVGGYEDGTDVSAIHLYKPDTGEWVKVGDLPTPRRSCTCVMLTDRELLVAGGWDGVMLKRVDIAQVY